MGIFKGCAADRREIMMQNRMKWLIILALFVTGWIGVQAATIDLLGNGTSTNGFYYWNDTNNWTGAVTATYLVTNSPRFSWAGKEKVFIYGHFSAIGAD